MKISADGKYQRKIPQIRTYVKRETRDKFTKLAQEQGETKASILRKLVYSYLKEYGYN